MKPTVIVQARMRSTRLPGKVLLPVLGKPLLVHQLDRLKRCRRVDAIVVATSDGSADDPIVETATAAGVPVFRGSELDVLSRYRLAAEEHGADPVIRVTSDCPMIDPAVIDRAIEIFQTGSYDYVSNTLARTFPRGMDAEVFSMAALRAADDEATEAPDREHVTRFLYARPTRFRLFSLEAEENASEHRWTVDAPEDFELVSRMMTELIPRLPDYALQDALRLIQERPEWSRLNAHVEQKKV